MYARFFFRRCVRVPSQNNEYVYSNSIIYNYIYKYNKCI